MSRVLSKNSFNYYSFTSLTGSKMQSRRLITYHLQLTTPYVCNQANTKPPNIFACTVK